MKLVSAVKRLNRVSGRRVSTRREPIAVVWSADDSRMELEPEPGELRAVDVFRDGPEMDGAQVVRTVERLAHGAGDLGFVFGPDGERVGVVTEREGSMITVQWDAAAAGGGGDGG
jgi:hypothetical protein